MKPAEAAFFEYIQQFKSAINVQNLPKVASNYLGDFYAANQDQLLLALAKQISGSVQWRKNMALMKHCSILELGPNRPLRGFFKSIGIDIQSVINLRSAIKAFESASNQ
jgi:malonyl CoA-acyl carrier protein transacylase